MKTRKVYPDVFPSNMKLVWLLRCGYCDEPITDEVYMMWYESLNHETKGQTFLHRQCRKPFASENAVAGGWSTAPVGKMRWNIDPKWVNRRPKKSKTA